MPTPKNTPYKVAQRISHSSKYRIYRKNKYGKITSTGYLRPPHRPFHMAGAGYSIASGLHIPSHVIDKRLNKRKAVNRIARLSRRANRK